MQGMDEQLDTVVTLLCLRTHCILRAYLFVPTVVGRCRELVDDSVILHLYRKRLTLPRRTLTRHIEELRSKSTIHPLVNPTLTQIEVQLFKGDRLGDSLLQSLGTLIHPQFLLVLDGLRQVACILLLGTCIQQLCHLRPQLLDLLQLLNDVATDKLRLNLVLVAYRQRVIEHLAMQGVQKFVLAHASKRTHILHVGLAVVVQRLSQCLLRCVGTMHIVGSESHRLREDVGFLPTATLVSHLQR